MAAVRRSTARDEGWPGERIAGVTNHGDSVTVTWGDGRHGRYHALWLRDNCNCAECRDAATGQRLLDVSALPATLGVSEAGAETELLRLTFAPEGHRGSVDAATRRARVPAKPADDPYILWDRELAARVPAAEHAAVVASRAALRHWLSLVRTFGFALLRGVPALTGEVARIAERFGYVRETNYGRIFDVVAKPAPNNLAFTGRALGAHTDNPYRDPVPGLQLLHCLEVSTGGGETLLVDGFRAAERLRRAAPEHFDLLTTHEVPFAFTTPSATFARAAR